MQANTVNLRNCESEIHHSNKLFCFPSQLLLENLKNYRSAKEFAFCQDLDSSKSLVISQSNVAIVIYPKTQQFIYLIPNSNSKDVQELFHLQLIIQELPLILGHFFQPFEFVITKIISQHCTMQISNVKSEIRIRNIPNIFLPAMNRSFSINTTTLCTIH